MSKRIDRITRRLEGLSACWAISATKFCSPNDPHANQLRGRKTWHIHPDQGHPHQDDVLRFDTLDAIEDWLDDAEAYQKYADAQIEGLKPYQPA